MPVHNTGAAQVFRVERKCVIAHSAAPFCRDQGHFTVVPWQVAGCARVIP
ncbi:hypothetical protein [Nocardioides sp. zg-DK7169]|nr:hypothetical protein [Nocardioides sp. zg-DK7169]NPC97445.1 hypothetical protein [Nocardioides sp. zg-DK7169]